jgi:hypothetical protein
MSWLDDKLIDDWRTEWRRLWSVRVAIFWGAFSGLVSILPVFGVLVPNRWQALAFFAVFNSLMCVVLVLARLAKQPGTEEP